MIENNQWVCLEIMIIFTFKKAVNKLDASA